MLFGELFDVLNSRNLLRKTTIPIDIAKLKKIWKNTIHYGDAFNEISRKFKRFQSEARAHPIDCLFCKGKYECEDPKNQATFHNSIKDIDDAIKRIEN